MEQPYNVFGYPNIRSQYWKRYDDSVGSMSAEQRNWVSQQEGVLNAKLTLRDSFIDYLFGLYRDAFVASDEKNRKVSDNYISELQNTASSYISHAEVLEKENRELKEKLEKLLGEKNDRMAANGSRRSRENNSEKTVREGNDSRTDSQNNELLSPESK